MRYLSIHLPFFATDRLHRLVAADRSRDASSPPPPLAITAKIKSAFRLIALDRRAHDLGLRPMMALADARAMHPHLAVHAADPQSDAATHAALVDWCRRFTPLAAPDGDDGVMLDITGAAHLFGGEVGLLEEVSTRLAAQGFSAQSAIAGTPGAAWALARYGNGVYRIDPDIEPPALAKIFAPMPLAALRLEAETIGRLSQAGLRRIGDLLLRPRAPIAARFGSAIHHRLDVLLGRARDPISPRFEAPPFVAERRFVDGIARREDIEATLLSLACDLCGLLARHGEGARRLDVALYRVDGVVKHIEAGTSRALRDPLAMARLFRERIEAAGEEGLDTGYGFDVVRLAALSAERLDTLQPGWADHEGGGADVADLVDRLGARFGLTRVRRLAMGESHQPERAMVAIPATFPSPACGRRWPPRQRRSDEGACQLSDPNPAGCEAPHPTLADARATFSRPKSGLPDLGTFEGRDRASPISLREKDEQPYLPHRPLRLFEQPEPIRTLAEVPDGPPVRFEWRRIMHHVAAIEGPERIGPDWWKQGCGRPHLTRDYFRAEDTDGRRFWVYREGLSREPQETRWFLHGLFA